MQKSVVRAHIFFEGRVQGVGFRYTAEQLAHELKLVGWVKNLPDSRVELVSEGPKESIKTLIERIRQSSSGRYIRKTSTIWEKATGEFRDFSVEFYL